MLEKYCTWRLCQLSESKRDATAMRACKGIATYLEGEEASRYSGVPAIWWLADLQTFGKMKIVNLAEMISNWSEQAKDLQKVFWGSDMKRFSEVFTQWWSLRETKLQKFWHSKEDLRAQVIWLLINGTPWLFPNQWESDPFLSTSIKKLKSWMSKSIETWFPCNSLALQCPELCHLGWPIFRGFELVCLPLRGRHRPGV